MQKLLGTHSVVKIKDKYYIFHVRAVLGGVFFGEASEAFHTEQEAHLYLIEKAKEISTPECVVSCVEVLTNYLFIATQEEKDSEA